MPPMRRPAAALRRPAAAADDLEPTGPVERGSSTRVGRARRQYCWWITFAQPFPETVARLNLRAPSDFARQTFLDSVLQYHRAAQIAPLEIVIFKEPHARVDAAGVRVNHLNALCRYGDLQHAWTNLGQQFKADRMRVDFSDHICTWYDGIVYGRVDSAHKPKEDIDPEPLQWAANGHPTPFNEVLPAKWHKHGRQPGLSPLQAYDMMMKSNVGDEAGAWALARKLEAEGQRGLLAFLLDNRSVQQFVDKIVMSRTSEEAAKRQLRGRIGILQDAATRACECTTQGLWYQMAREQLARNNLDGEFQRHVYSALSKGRQKQENFFLIGPTNTAKSYLLKPLAKIYQAYQPPDQGSYPLELLPDAEILLLNDFTWDDKWMKWSYMKNFMEGGSIPLSMPKNRRKDFIFDKDAPVFGTAPAEIQLAVRDRSHVFIHQDETAQMNSRMKYVYMNVPIRDQDVVRIRPCACCGAKLYLEGASSTQPPASTPPPISIARACRSVTTRARG